MAVERRRCERESTPGVADHDLRHCHTERPLADDRHRTPRERIGRVIMPVVAVSRYAEEDVSRTHRVRPIRDPGDVCADVSVQRPRRTAYKL